jgi:hypothetical protein
MRVVRPGIAQRGAFGDAMTHRLHALVVHGQ